MFTLVFGASLNPNRYSYLAIKKLVSHFHNVIAFGLKTGEVSGINITSQLLHYDNIDTVTLYIGAKKQKQYYKYIVGLAPNRVIFNPGTENIEFYQLLNKEGIHFEIACTLVLLSTNQY